MTSKSRPSVVSFLVAGFTALAGARVFAPRAALRVHEDAVGMRAAHGAPSDPPSAASIAAGYDVHDAAAGRLAWTMLIFAASAITSVALMVLFLSLLHHQDASRDAAFTPQQRVQPPPPLPHLQADPLEEIAALRARQDAKLHNYARIDAHTARIPIDRAMALVLGQSLDAHAAPEPAQ
jgi:hypothetical protein